MKIRVGFGFDVHQLVPGFLKVFLLGNKKHRISTVRSVRYILFYDSRKLEFTVLPSFPSSAP